LLESKLITFVTIISNIKNFENDLLSSIWAGKSDY